MISFPHWHLSSVLFYITCIFPVIWAYPKCESTFPSKSQSECPSVCPVLFRFQHVEMTKTCKPLLTGQHSCQGDQSRQLFSRDSDKVRQSHRMRRFARQNLINRIDYGQSTRCVEGAGCNTFTWSDPYRRLMPWTLVLSTSLGLRNRIILAMASSGAMVATYSSMAQLECEVNRE